MALYYLIVKEFKQMMRNIVLPVIFLLMPLVVINVIPRIATQEVKHLTFVVVDNDHSPLSARLVNKMAASKYFDLLGTCSSYGKALESIEKCEADMVLEIEPQFERNLMSTGVANVNISANAVNGMKGGLGSSYATQIVADYAAQLRDEMGLDAGATRLAGIDVAPRFLYNVELDYKLYMIPALLSMILIILVGFLPAINIVGEKEKGTIEQINVTPVGRLQFILSKIIPHVVVGLILLAFAMVLARAIHGFTPVGSLWLIFALALVFCVVVSSMGLIISNYSSTTQQASLTYFFFMMIFMLMSGLLSPVSSMPQWAQAITAVNPMRYLMEAMRTLYMKQASFHDLSQQFFRLAAMGVVLWVWAIASYKKST